MVISWHEFYQATKDNPHWPLMERAAALLPNKGHALDLGCGAGRDTRYLLREGWRVTAVDREPEAITLLSELRQDRLQTVQSSIEDFDFQPETYDLVSAQFALPFISRPRFRDTFARLKASLKPGGIFTGQFFGINDQWNEPGSDITFLTQDEIDLLLADMRVIEFNEVDEDGTTAFGDSKHWHVFHVIAQRAP